MESQEDQTSPFVIGGILLVIVVILGFAAAAAVKNFLEEPAPKRPAPLIETGEQVVQGNGYVVQIGPGVLEGISDEDLLDDRTLDAPVFTVAVGKEPAWLSCVVRDEAGLVGGGGYAALSERNGGTMRVKLVRPLRPKAKLACFIVPVKEPPFRTVPQE